jgi:hypothetical protein
MLANFSAMPDADLTIVMEESSRSASLALGGRWRKPSGVQVLEGGLAEAAPLIGASDAEFLILASLSCVCVLDPGALLALATTARDHLVKISVGRTPIEMYCGRKEPLARILEAAARRANARAHLRESLFEGALHSAIDLIEDLPGELLFQNNLMEYFTNNLWLVANGQSGRYHQAASRLPELADKGMESHVAERGLIRNSWLASGVEVEGTVEDSIIFPNVVIRRNAVVSHSVVANGNRIGAGTEIHNALILPFVSDAPRNSPNIGDNCSIGAKASIMKNSDFPAHIRDGLAVLGVNADIPNGFRAEAGTYIAPGVQAATLRRLKVLKKGSSVLDARATVMPGRNGGDKSTGYGGGRKSTADGGDA